MKHKGMPNAIWHAQKGAKPGFFSAQFQIYVVTLHLIPTCLPTC